MFHLHQKNSHQLYFINKHHLILHFLLQTPTVLCHLLNLILCCSVGGVTKSQNSSQMNLSGSSSSLTSDASTKTGVSLRSYGIGGAFLHKRIQLMTGQHSRGSSRERETELEKITEEMMQEETEAAQRGLRSSEQRRGRSRQQSKRSSQTDAEQMLPRTRAGTPALKCLEARRSPHGLPEAGLATLSPPPQSHFMKLKPSVSPIRARLMSPFRVLREKSQSRERSLIKNGEQTIQTDSPSPQNETQVQTEQRARRAVSPNPFLWLCRDRHTRSKTVWLT